MDRGSTVEFQTEIAKSQNMPIHLISVHLDVETLYMNDSYKTISYEGNDYLAVGSFISFSNIEETTDVVVSSISLSLSGIDQQFLGVLLSNPYINRLIKIHKGFLDDSQNIIADPILIFEGLIDNPSITENPDTSSSVISVNATNAWVDFSRKTGRRANNEEQQVLYPDDKGFEFASQNISDLVWRDVQ